MSQRESVDKRRQELIQQWNERNKTLDDDHDAKPTDPRKRRIVWDEETIAEHDKERGTRMKIDEADTPFEYLVEEEEETTKEEKPVTFETLAAKLETVKAQRDEGLTDEDVKKQKFKDKRKDHYNMGARMRAMREQMKREEEEEARRLAVAKKK